MGSPEIIQSERSKGNVGANSLHKSGGDPEAYGHPRSLGIVETKSLQMPAGGPELVSKGASSSEMPSVFGGDQDSGDKQPG